MNIHSGESWDEVFHNCKKFLPDIKQRVAGENEFGVGLRLSAKAVLELINNGHALSLFKVWLETNGLYVFTMNGFPYGGFHHTKVKDAVHLPDWTTQERVDYTLQLFKVLHYLMPAGLADAGISTSPISYRPWYDEAESKQVCELAVENIMQVVVYLYQVKKETGVSLHLDIEPEPDGFLECSDDVVHFFKKILIPLGQNLLRKKLLVDEEEAESIILDHVQICYDVCHFALAYEEPAVVIEKFERERIKVGKVQLSAALQVRSMSLSDGKIKEALRLFEESTYLHQVRGDQNVSYQDLSQALDDGAGKTSEEWRIHFHVPLFLSDLGLLSSTQEEVKKVLKILKYKDFTRHLEVETYTWEVLPEELKTDLKESIIRELEWVKEEYNY